MFPRGCQRTPPRPKPPPAPARRGAGAGHSVILAPAPPRPPGVPISATLSPPLPLPRRRPSTGTRREARHPAPHLERRKQTRRPLPSPPPATPPPPQRPQAEQANHERRCTALPRARTAEPWLLAALQVGAHRKGAGLRGRLALQLPLGALAAGQASQAGVLAAGRRKHCEWVGERERKNTAPEILTPTRDQRGPAPVSAPREEGRGGGPPLHSGVPASLLQPW